MAKFIKLIGNEWRKQFHRISCWIMVILLAVLVLGMGIIDSISIDYESSWTLEDECRSEIGYLSEFADEVVDAKSKLLFYQCLLEIGATYDDWRYECGVVETYADSLAFGDTVQAERLLTIIRNNDAGAYFEFVKESAAQNYPDSPAMQAVVRELADFCIENEVVPSYSDWRYAQVNKLQDSRFVLIEQEALLAAESPFYNEKTEEKAKNDAALAAYQLERNLEINLADTFIEADGWDPTRVTSCFWSNMKSTASLSGFISFCMIIIAGGIVAGEYSSGTVKFLLIAPVKRWKILTSKYATVMLIGLMMTGILFVTSFLSSLIIWGGSEIGLTILTAADGVVKSSSPFGKLFVIYLQSAVSPILMATLAFAISSISRNTALAVGVSLSAYFVGETVTSVLALLGMDWARYLLFANTDFVAIADGTTLFAHQSLTAAIVVVVLHMVVFLLTAWDGFCRREI